MVFTYIAASWNSVSLFLIKILMFCHPLSPWRHVYFQNYISHGDGKFMVLLGILIRAPSSSQTYHYAYRVKL